MSIEKAQQALDKAKIGLMMKKGSVFLTTILFSLKTKLVEGFPALAGVDGINLFIEPNAFLELNDKERMGLLAHEAWHVAFKHMLRVGHRDPELWNIAGDYVINNMLDTAGFVLPEGGLINHDYDNMSTEQVYTLLVEDVKKKGKPNLNLVDLMAPAAPNGNDSGEKGENGDSPRSEIDDAIQEAQALANEQALERKIDDILVKAQVAQQQSGSKMAGSIPGEIEVTLEELLNPTLPWHVILFNLISDLDKEDYTMRRPNKRFWPDFHLPSPLSESLMELTIAVDCSGSVSDQDFAAFMTEIQSIKDTLNPKKIEVVSFDTKIQNVHDLYKDDSVLDLTFTGRGGTSFSPVIKRAKENPPNALIIFSDMYCSVIPKEEEPPCPVFWISVLNKNATVEFGQLIHMEIDYD